MSKAKEPNKLKAVYTGRRVYGDRVIHQFLAGDKTYAFATVKHVWIGDTYHLLSFGKDDVRCPKIPTRVDDAPVTMPKDLKQWEVEDAIARDFGSRKALAAKLKRNPRYLKALEELDELVGSLDPFDLEPFVRQVTKELWKRRNRVVKK